MALTLSAHVKAYRALPRLRGSGPRKIGLLGSHQATLESAPWDDPTWELWGHASSRHMYARPADLYFDLHRKECWTRKGKGSGYVKWLGRNTVPIYMQRQYPEVPASVEYPLRRILAEWPQRFMTSHVCFMAALALSEGATHIGLFGCNYGADTEYETQRGGTQFWLGIAAGRGVQLVLPEGSTILADPPALYGYESHDEKGELVPAYRARKMGITVGAERRELDMTKRTAKAQPPAHLNEQIAEDEAVRPAWMKQWLERLEAEGAPA